MEESVRRRALREHAGRLSDHRGQFAEFMEKNGMSREMREVELRKYDEMIETMEDQAEYEAVDGLE
jgi:hypothetical protein